MPQRFFRFVRPSSMQGTGGETYAFQRRLPCVPEVSMCERPLEALSWCHFGQAEPPYWGGGGGGGGWVNSMLMMTLA